MMSLMYSCNNTTDNEGDEISTQYLFECIDGMAGEYPCNGYDLMANISSEELGGIGASVNDSWGWTDPTTSREYALIGTTTSTAFVDITNPSSPLFLGRLPTATVNDVWRDIKVYNNHAFIVSEASGHGMQVFDLTKLRNVANPPETFTVDAHYTGFGGGHNIVINETSGYAYGVGTNTFLGGPHFINIQDPTNPIAEGGFSDYSHDAQVVTYNGPDSDYTGHEIFIGSNVNDVVIIDVSDKNNPILISSISYNNIGYTHQGWFTDDMSYFLIGDEFDELNYGNNTRTIVLDFNDLDNPTIHMEYLGQTAAVDHNGYVKGNTFYLANYTAGLRTIDITNIASKIMNEEGYFDTHPESNNANYSGAWSVYPYFTSGNIIISDRDRGIFIVRKSE